MKVLLDSHTFLWWNTDDPRLSEQAREIIANGQNAVFLSTASVWEIILKAKNGKLILPEDPAGYITKRMKLYHIQPLPIQISHVLRVYELPQHHDNQFNHLLVAQSQLERMPLLTANVDLKKYEVETIW